MLMYVKSYSFTFDVKYMGLRTTEEVKRELAERGIAVNEWARQMGYSPGLVHQVLAGRLKCVRGQAHDVAVVLGLKFGLVGGVNDLPFSGKGGEK